MSSKFSTKKVDITKPKTQQIIEDNYIVAEPYEVVYTGDYMGKNKQITAQDILNLIPNCTCVVRLAKLQRIRPKRKSEALKGFSELYQSIPHKANYGKSRQLDVDRIAFKVKYHSCVFSASIDCILSTYKLDKMPNQNLFTPQYIDELNSIKYLSMERIWFIAQQLPRFKKIFSNIPYNETNSNICGLDFNKRLKNIRNLDIRYNKKFKSNIPITDKDLSDGLTMDLCNDYNITNRGVLTDYRTLVWLCTLGKTNLYTNNTDINGIVDIPDCLYKRFIHVISGGVLY